MCVTASTPSVCSPSHLLPLEAYCGDTPLAEVRTDQVRTCPVLVSAHLQSHHGPVQAASSTGVVVWQSSLDVELWLNEALLEGIQEEGFTFHSLTDYDLQLVEVSTEIHPFTAYRFSCDIVYRCVVLSGRWCTW